MGELGQAEQQERQLRDRASVLQTSQKEFTKVISTMKELLRKEEAAEAAEKRKQAEQGRKVAIKYDSKASGRPAPTAAPSASSRPVGSSGVPAPALQEGDFWRGKLKGAGARCSCACLVALIVSLSRPHGADD
jgi:hypothetical protein